MTSHLGRNIRSWNWADRRYLVRTHVGLGLFDRRLRQIWWNVRWHVRREFRIWYRRYRGLGHAVLLFDRITGTAACLFQQAEGRGNGLPSINALLRSYAATAGRGFDHPRLDSRLLHQDPLLVPKCSNGIACHLKRLVAIVCHVAGLQGRLVHEVSVFFRPVLEKIDGVCQREYLPNQAFPFLQIDGTSKVRVHRYLTENVGVHQVWRLEPSAVCRFILSLFPFQYLATKILPEVRS